MKLEYNVTGAERKKLVEAMSRALEIGGYTISKDGTVIGEDNPVLVEVLRDIASDNQKHERIHPKTRQILAYEVAANS